MRPLLIDPETGIYTFREVEGDKVRYRHMPDTDYTDACFAENKASRDAESTAPRRNVPSLEKAAEIPITLWFLWESMGITADPNELKRAIERNPEVKVSKKRLI